MPDLSFENSAENADDLDIILMHNSSQEVDIDTAKTLPKRNKFVWETYAEYDDVKKAMDFLNSEGFVSYDTKELISGQKIYFRCKHVPKSRKIWCEKRYIIHLPNDSLKTIILHNSNEHNHNLLLSGVKRPPSKEMLEFLYSLFSKGTIKTANVLKHIDGARRENNKFEFEMNPDRRQIEYCLRKYRSAEIKPMIKLGDLMEYCRENSNLPEDGDKAFVIGYTCNEMHDQLGFNMVMSTPNLLLQFIGRTTIAIDGTYNLNFLGYPTIHMGILDRAKKFHTLVLGCTTNETTEDYTFVFQAVKDALKKYFQHDFKPKILIADGANAIRNSFYAVFESAELDVMCNAHVVRNVDKRSFTNKNNKQIIKDDIRKIQVSPNEATFRMMTKLFCEKWETIEPDFVRYFKKELLGSHCNWYEGVAHYTASTNNGLEGSNAGLKLRTFRKRLALNDYLITMTDILEDRSKEFSSGIRTFATEPTIKNNLISESASMVLNGFKTFKVKSSNPNELIFLVPSSTCSVENATEAHYKALAQTKWRSFDHFVKYGYQKFWNVKVSRDDWKINSNCTCPEFFKNYACKHVTALALREKLFECPPSAYPNLLQATRKKPGRPKGAAKALIVQ